MKILRKNGFLLIELIVAVSILSIGLVLVLRSFLSGSSAAGIISDKISSLELIETRMAQAEELAELGLLKDGGDSIDVLVGPRKGQLSMRVSRYSGTESGDIKNVRINVSWKSGGKDRDETMEAYIKNKAAGDQSLKDAQG